MSAQFPDGSLTISSEQEQLALARRTYTLKKLHDDNTRLRDQLQIASDACKGYGETIKSMQSVLLEINTWCGTDAGAQALPYEPPWYASLRTALCGHPAFQVEWADPTTDKPEFPQGEFPISQRELVDDERR